MGKKKKVVKKINKKKSNQKIKTKKKKIRTGRILFVVVILLILIYLFTKVFSFPIKNIYVTGNSMFSDQEIIEIAKLSDYPSIWKYSSHKIESILEKNTYIKDAKVTKKRAKEVYITIEENRPLFYNKPKESTVLSDKTEVKAILESPILINYIPNTLYDKFIDKILTIDSKIYSRVSEIKYDPNKVDNKRFLFTMNDGNYVYLTLNHFDKINNYVEIMQKVVTKYNKDKGILYLDEGEYFQKK